MKEAEIKGILLQHGADLCGIANAAAFCDAPVGFHPQDLLAKCKSVVVFAKRIPCGMAEVEPRILYANATTQSITAVDGIAFSAACALEETLECKAVPVPCDTPYEAWNAELLRGQGLISMRHAAVLAGLGTMGKNTLVLSERFGNLITIGAILTSLDLHSDPKAKEFCISGCHKCLDACPQQALDGITVEQRRCRPHTYGQNAKGYEVVNCNACRMACPRRAGMSSGFGAKKD